VGLFLTAPRADFRAAKPIDGKAVAETIRNMTASVSLAQKLKDEIPEGGPDSVPPGPKPTLPEVQKTITGQLDKIQTALSARTAVPASPSWPAFLWCGVLGGALVSLVGLALRPKTIVWANVKRDDLDPLQKRVEVLEEKMAQSRQPHSSELMTDELLIGIADRMDAMQRTQSRFAEEMALRQEAHDQEVAALRTLQSELDTVRNLLLQERADNQSALQVLREQIERAGTELSIKQQELRDKLSEIQGYRTREASLSTELGLTKTQLEALQREQGHVPDLRPTAESLANGVRFLEEEIATCPNPDLPAFLDALAAELGKAKRQIELRGLESAVALSQPLRSEKISPYPIADGAARATATRLRSMLDQIRSVGFEHLTQLAGLRPLLPATGQAFNPEIHEDFDVRFVRDPARKDRIVQATSPGLLTAEGKVVKKAQVVVYRYKADAPEELIASAPLPGRPLSGRPSSNEPPRPPVEAAHDALDRSLPTAPPPPSEPAVVRKTETTAGVDRAAAEEAVVMLPEPLPADGSAEDSNRGTLS
jgi:hypothetical protein